MGTRGAARRMCLGSWRGVPRELAALPQGHRTAEVWCGSEFTLAADEHGRMWGCGWNEHGNVGCGIPVAADGTADAALH